MQCLMTWCCLWSDEAIARNVGRFGNNINKARHTQGIIQKADGYECSTEIERAWVVWVGEGQCLYAVAVISGGIVMVMGVVWFVVVGLVVVKVVVIVMYKVRVVGIFGF